ncbi:outer membrane beta-barrel family protein [Sphingobacterium sp. E70]|uniref:outer membrane beta-barrel family protein n=1 Tax=Sphingobacterium sp. E70 TaxID=2853439 RepID=UPI00211C0908|nr:outer membrane beta-barrel family protein [Sphingobacterium sp. E70]ULT22328.1 outer membrane beta-barrel family protein [Sphingobacterium sp. E70]
MGDVYYNLNRSNAVSTNQINSAESVEVKLKNQIQNIGTTFRWSKSKFDFNTNIYYERSNNKFENDLEHKSTMRNKGLLYNSSLIVRGLKSRLNNTFTFGKVIIYPTLSQKNPTNVTLSDNYSSIGNPDLKNQSVFNFNWSSNYQLKNADNLNLGFSTSLNRNKIIENLSVLKNDTTISGVDFIKGIRLLSYANSKNTNSPNSNLVLTYVKNNLFIPNLNLQNGLSYSISATDRYINDKSFSDKSTTYSANINTFYYREGFSANILYNLSLNHNSFISAEENQLSSTFRTLSQSISTTAKLNYFALFNLEISNNYNVINSSGISFENNRTDVTLSQKYFKGKLEASLNIFDLFNQMRQNKILKNDFLIRRESRSNLIGRYFLLNITYKFQNLKS